MKKITRNIRITSSVIFIVILSVVSVASIGYIGHSGMNTINRNVSHIYNDAVLQTQAATRISDQFMSMRLEIWRLSETGFNESIINDIERMDENLTQLIEEYDVSIAADSRQRTVFNTAINNYNQFIDAFHEYTAALKAQDGLETTSTVPTASDAEVNEESEVEETANETEEITDQAEETSDEVDEASGNDDIASTESEPEVIEASQADTAVIDEARFTLESRGRSIMNNLAFIVDDNQEMAESLYHQSMTVYRANVDRTLLITGVASGLLILVSLVVITMIRASLKEMSQLFGILSTGDFTQEINEKQKNEFGIMKKALKTTTANISEMIVSTKKNMQKTDENANALSKICEDMALGSQEVATSIQEVASGASKQSQSLSDISEIMDGFGEKLEKTVALINHVHDDAEKTGNAVTGGNEKLEALVISSTEIGKSFDEISRQVQALDQRLKEIGNITDSINQISEQTNLLALNAAIEAARAGDAGRGFAVVAEEIRKLAEQAGTSSQNINKLLDGIVKESHEIVGITQSNIMNLKSQEEVVDESIQTFKIIFDALTQMIPRIEEVNESVQSVNESKDVIIEKVKNVSDVSMDQSAIAQQIAASSEEMNASIEEIASTSQTLSMMTKDMTDELEKFIVKDEEDNPEENTLCEESGL